VPVLTDIGSLATPVRRARQGILHVIDDAAVVWRDDRIEWVGARSTLPPDYARETPVSAHGGLVVPGLIDAHTHLAFGGWRAAEFEQRLLGRSYRDIARAGGGILQTVALTRQASASDLLARCEAHLAAMAALGVTTVECKSGYGLTIDEELKLLRVYRSLASRQPLRLVPTFLGAHIVPPEYRERRDEYVSLVCDGMLRAVAAERLATFCDVFVEESAFSGSEARAILLAAARHGMRAKLHVDQLTDGGGARLAAEMEAVSADHLEHVSTDGIRALAAAGTVAVSLPIATLYLRQSPLPARALLDAGVAVAVATDFNPGSAPSYHLPLAMMLACTLQGMTPSEVLWGTTAAASRALDLESSIGALEPGMSADFAVIDAPDVDHWLYHFRANACTQTWVRGARVH
jgi:imidazolonepropionase